MVRKLNFFVINLTFRSLNLNFQSKLNFSVLKLNFSVFKLNFSVLKLNCFVSFFIKICQNCAFLCVFNHFYYALFSWYRSWANRSEFGFCQFARRSFSHWAPSQSLPKSWFAQERLSDFKERCAQLGLFHLFIKLLDIKNDSPVLWKPGKYFKQIKCCIVNVTNDFNGCCFKGKFSMG